MPNSGWPVSRKELEPYYRRAQPIFELGRYGYRMEDWVSKECTSLPFKSDRIATALVQHSPPTRFGITYRNDIAGAKDIAAYLYANVTDIRTDESAARVVELQVASLSGNKFVVRARNFVLATGGIENARLLLLSDKIQPTGLANEHGIVGRYFSDHPYLSNLGVIVVADPGVSATFYRKKLRLQDSVISAFLAPSPEVRRREKLLACRVHMRPAPWEKFGVVRGQPAEERDLTDKVYSIAQNWLGHALPEKTKPEDYNEPRHARLFRVGAWTEVIPRAESRIRLGEERDGLGQRRVVLDWRVGSEEKRSLIRSLEILGAEIGRAGFGRLRLDLDEDSNWPWTGGGEPGLHHMGSTRMHQDTRQGVVDKDCKVHGVSNLYIAGSSVFATYGIANPTFTIVALALRLSDHLKKV